MQTGNQLQEEIQMTCEEVRKFLWREPFQPVRVRLKDGRTFDIVHPNLGLAAEAIFIIGIPPANEPDAWYSDRQVWVQWADVEAVEPLPQPALSAPGSSKLANGNKITLGCEEMRKHLWQKPFQPMRVRLKDGRTFDIRHRNLGLAAEAIFIIGIPPANEPDAWFADRQVWVQWADVEGVEPLPQAAQSTARG
jgi:hypothetical protein